MRFDEWYDKFSGWGPDRCSEYHLAKDAWNAAISEAEDACCLSGAEDSHFVQREIEKLKAI